MKSAYELAMERFNDGDAPAKLSEEQKARIAEIGERQKAKIAEQKLSIASLVEKARAEGNYVEIEKLEAQLVHEIAGIEERSEAEKEKVRKAGD